MSLSKGGPFARTLGTENPVYSQSAILLKIMASSKICYLPTKTTWCYLDTAILFLYTLAKKLKPARIDLFNGLFSFSPLDEGNHLMLAQVVYLLACENL